jgi:hypothetical protein
MRSSRLITQAVPEPEQRVGRVERHVGPARLDGSHAGRQLERKRALRFVGAGEDVQERPRVRAVVRDEGGDLVRKGGQDRRAVEETSTTVGTVAATSRTWATNASSKSSEPAWK